MSSLLKSAVKLGALLLIAATLAPGARVHAAEKNLGESTKSIPSLHASGIFPIGTIGKTELTRLDNRRLRDEDQQRLANRDVASKPVPLFFGQGRKVSINPENNGTWEWLDDGKLLWRQVLSSPGAYSISLGVTSYRMPVGGEMYVYSPDYRHVKGPFTERDNRSHGQLWTPIVPGDAIVVEIVLPDGNIDDLDFEITRLIHDYRGEEGSGLEPLIPLSSPLLPDDPPPGEPPPDDPPPWNPAGDSKGCHVDVECIGNNTQVDNALPSGINWNNRVRSVGMLYVYSETAEKALRCTATLINNTAMDGKPYLLTAYHCINPDDHSDLFSSFEELLASVTMYWNFEHDQCRDFANNQAGGNGGTTPVDYTTGGATLVSQPDNRDLVVLELNSTPSASYNLYYAGWNRTGDTATTGVCIHHARSDVKRVTIDTAPISSTDVYWDIGITEGGSSGSSLFEQNGNSTGVLSTQWFYACGDSDGKFTTLSNSWDEEADGTVLSSALDPEDIGYQYFNGIDGDDLGCRQEIENVTYQNENIEGCVVVTGPAVNFGTGSPPSAINLLADRFIKLKDGTHVKPNTEFHAYIN